MHSPRIERPKTMQSTLTAEIAEDSVGNVLKWILLAVAIHADQAVRQIVIPRREAGMVNQVSHAEMVCRVMVPAVAVMVTAAR